jgi:hypothetical protein
MHQGETEMKIKTLVITAALALVPLASQAQMADMSDAAMSEVHGSLLDIDAAATVFGYGFTVTDLGWDRNRGFSLGWTQPVIP